MQIQAGGANPASLVAELNFFTSPDSPEVQNIRLISFFQDSQPASSCFLCSVRFFIFPQGLNLVCSAEQHTRIKIQDKVVHQKQDCKRVKTRLIMEGFQD